ncbi:MAG: bifunctional phosphopantothenoylcysteine decarboxylase/phosphopantothenate--cysteine ligase CoaBC, partial [Candidatus Marinimicrobia bacterium]|nr:bifunctional phosphopantothenoylcysteine decarboxylase/phosphopantothenate--cysteine ligase CoaBC [Candidatus Neomarinimicrobiota bacterium]
PAMNKNMYSNPAFQQNLAFLKAKAYKIIDAETGALATNIEGEGKGRLADESVILDWIDNYFSQSLPLKGKKVLISAGPTREYIDQLRFISNPSSGKMGIALAEAAKDLGADVHLVYGPGSELPPETINRHDVVTTMDMKNAMLKKYEWADIVIMAAAVEDIKPVSTFKGKLKKESIPNSLALETTEDILLELGIRKKKQILLGFSVENEDILENSRKKLEKKKLDFIVINNPSEPGAGFGVDTNKVIILDSDNKTIAFPLSTKKDIAKKIMLYIKEKKA